jgi:hypothetical protein
MDGEISLRMILLVLAAIGGGAVLVLVVRSFRVCSKHTARRAALEHILGDDEPPHHPR